MSSWSRWSRIILALVLLALVAACAPVGPGMGEAPATVVAGQSADMIHEPGPSSASTPPPAAPALQTAIRDVAARHRGKIGVYVKHLETGEVATLNADQRFRPASLYKLFVLHSAFARADAGKLALDEVLTLSQRAVKNEPYVEWRAGTQTATSCALDAMTTISNNAAAAMLVERLGGEEQITSEMHRLGLTNSSITATSGYTTPADLGRLLELIASKKAVSAGASDAMLDLLRQQQRNDRLPLPLPIGVDVAHKTGELPKLRNDAGIVYAPSGTYVFVALVQGAPSDAAARSAIVDLSRVTYAQFEPDGLATTFGLAPRLAVEVFRTLDEKGRIRPLADEWAETVMAAPAGAALAEGAKNVKLREMVVPDLIALQQAARNAGAEFWVTGGYRAPRGVDAPLVDPSARRLACRVTVPPKKASETPRGAPIRPATSTRMPTPTASQHWLGTVVAIADAPDGKASAPDIVGSATGRWLMANAWRHGFILAPAETKAGEALGYEPWTLRWVGAELAAELGPAVGQPDYSATVTARLRDAQRIAARPSPRKVAAAP